MSSNSTVVVGIADCAVTTDSRSLLITYALGSCIAVALHDPVSKVSGLLHFMLPAADQDSVRGKANPYMYADTGLASLLAQVTEKGAMKRRLLVRIAGGAQTMQNEFFNIGKRNNLALKKLLWKAGLLLETEAIGGAVSRTVSLETGSGKFTVRETPISPRQKAPVEAIPPRSEVNGYANSTRG